MLAFVDAKGHLSLVYRFIIAHVIMTHKGRIMLWGILIASFSFAAKAQTNNDAYRLSNETLSGTARYQSMGGAFGALGGDFSSTKQNPAGMGIAKRNEFQFTYGTMYQRFGSDWYDVSEKSKMNRSQKNSPLSSMSLTIAGFSDNSRLGGSFSFGFSPRHSFSRRFKASNNTRMRFSVADFAAVNTPSNLTHQDLMESLLHNPYQTVAAPWIAVLGHNAGWTVWNNEGQYYDSTFAYDGLLQGPEKSSFELIEQGAATDFVFNGALNWDDTFYAGVGLTATMIDYHMYSAYHEDFLEGDYLNLENEVHTKGGGVSLSVGAIYRPVDFLRLGASYFSPTWTNLVDSYIGWADSRYSKGLDPDKKPFPPEKWIMKGNTPKNAATEYTLTMPSKFVLSAAGIMGSYGLISADVEFIKNSDLALPNTDTYTYSNKLLATYYRPTTLSVKLGAELRPTPQLSLRGGFNYRQAAVTGDLTPQAGQYAVIPMESAGTVPHYDLEGDLFNYTCGFGYRFTQRLYMDVAIVLGNRHYYAYPFPTVTGKNKAGKVVNWVESPAPIKVTENQIRGALSFGYRF